MIKHRKGLMYHVKDEPVIKIIDIKGREKNERVVLSLIGTYTLKEQAVLKHLFGLGDIAPRTQEEVARFYGIPLRSVKRIEQNFLFYLFEEDRIKTHNERVKNMVSKLYKDGGRI